MKRKNVWKRIAIGIAVVVVGFFGYAYYEYRQFEKGMEDLARGLADIAKAFNNVEVDSVSMHAADSLGNSTTITLVEK